MDSNESISPYVYRNTDYLRDKVKGVLKAEMAAQLTREQAAVALRLLADKYEAKTPVDQQMTFPELREHIESHLGKRVS